jgi:hypothetical protein
MEKYNYVLPIDITSFVYYGGTEEYRDGREDSKIVFRLEESDTIVQDSEFIVEKLRENLKLNVDKNKYVTIRTKFEDYETDKRPVIGVRLPRGIMGLCNPAHFDFTTEETYGKWCDRVSQQAANN